MAELLFELLSEEIPARMQAKAAADLKRLVSERLKAAGLAYSSVESYATPRRIVLVADGLPDKQPDVSEEKKGPKVGAPEQAIGGFLKANGLTSVDEAEVRETPKGSFYFLVKEIAGQATAEVLPGILIESVQALPWAKSMRWARTGFRWVRPLHSIVALFDAQVLEGALDLGNGMKVHFGNSTVGHRFMSDGGPIEVTGFADYKEKLAATKVMLDPADRRRVIAETADRITSAEGLSLKTDEALLDEVSGLVEWPVVMMGNIDEDFMSLPPEVLSTSMRSHQKYFSVQDGDRLANRFLFVANMEADDGGATIIEGNKRVLSARLADARFFWDQDCQQPLTSRTPALSDIVFHAKLGTLDQKVDRVEALAAELSAYIPGADKDRARSAARLAKADLVTGMVSEFPELQGIMGRYYALQDGEHVEVAQAIAEHYSPLGPSDACPSAPVSVAVALADKIDILIGFFAIDEKPTGSKDPYALRRAALGVIRLIVENGLRLPLKAIFEAAQKLYPHLDSTSVGPDLMVFFADRLKVALKDKGVRHDLVTAVFALGGEDDLVRLLARVEALGAFIDSEDGANLLVAFRRAANIVRIEEKKDSTSYSGEVSQEAFEQNEERALFDALEQGSATAGSALSEEDFTAAMAALAQLRQPVDRYFEDVTVNAKDIDLRVNRLRLLSRIGATLGRVADFSKIEG
ncbi:glycine--tRNA ligase subunit beta [Pelagibius sp. Alg239-R121]|uniref:glycine--tRNA ligase subunit beta n=1 Tax=Pelagibius sp. Alg239-R121 TaxID=2993448 RepID=UPI0024A75751|nr:glycine--tRNA ligase subunit beta [Pelagibius sp. Alg239-R121]